MTTEHENEKIADRLAAVLCDPEGRCVIDGSDGDRREVEAAIASLRHSQAGGAVAWMQYDALGRPVAALIDAESIQRIRNAHANQGVPPPDVRPLYAHPPTPASEAVRELVGFDLVAREMIKAAGVIRSIGGMGHDSTDKEIADEAIRIARGWQREEEHDAALRWCRDYLAAAIAEPVAAIPAGEFVPAKAMRDLYTAYVRMMETGRDRIRDLGGSCDPVDVMEANDPALTSARLTLRDARERLAAAPKDGGK